jgi:alcohol dehydrogenase (NADP+)
VLSTDQDAMSQHQLSFDYILSTIPTSHDINPYVNLLKWDATLTLVGALEPLEPGLNNSQVAFHRRSVAGSLIGGIAETQEVLDFYGEHGIVSDVQVIPIQQINKAYERMLKGEVRYRFVIDMASLQQEFN